MKNQAVFLMFLGVIAVVVGVVRIHNIVTAVDPPMPHRCPIHSTTVHLTTNMTSGEMQAVIDATKHNSNLVYYFDRGNYTNDFSTMFFSDITGQFTIRGG